MTDAASGMAPEYHHGNPPVAYLTIGGRIAVAGPKGNVLFRLTLAAAEDFADQLARHAEYGRQEARPK